MPIIRNDIPEGHSRDDMIILVRDFPQHACLTGGDELPPLESLTPELVPGRCRIAWRQPRG